jgi:hypothetical protein
MEFVGTHVILFGAIAKSLLTDSLSEIDGIRICLDVTFPYRLFGFGFGFGFGFSFGFRFRLDFSP